MIYHLTAFCIGFFVDLLLGDPLGSFHIVVWIGKGISLLEKFLLYQLHPAAGLVAESFLCWQCFNGFLDNPREHSLQNQLNRNQNLVILQAVTKLYAMAGLRLGFAFCVGQKLREQLWGFGQSWPVSVVAQEAGIAALQDVEYLEHSLSMIRNCATYPGLKNGYYRIALRMPKDNDKIIAAIQKMEEK